MATTNGDISLNDSSLDNPYADNPQFQKLISRGFKEKVAMELTALFQKEVMKFEDLEERTVDSLRSLPQEQALSVLKQFKDANLLGVQNKAAFLGTCVKTFRERTRQVGPQTALTTPLIGGPDVDKLKNILSRTGYNIDVTIGQRKYGGPPPNWSGAQPSGGCEIYVGRLPNDVYEDELIPLFEECGKIWDLRLMMNPLTSQNKGYAFITYTNKEDAAAASEKFVGYEIKPGRKLKVNVSVANTRLFVGNMPKNKSREEIIAEFSQLTEGLQDVIIYTTPDDIEKRKNRGFAFLQYSDHKTASAAKRRLSGGKVKPWARDVMVDWAEALEEPDNDTMAKVKILYVKNLKQEVSEDDIRKEFEKFGEVERVKRQRDYAFVHFAERENALKAMDSLQGREFSGVACDVCLAKPQMDRAKKSQLKRERERRQGFFPSTGGFAPFEGYGAPPRGGFRGGRGGGGRFTPAIGFDYGSGFPGAAAFGPSGAPWEYYPGTSGYGLAYNPYFCSTGFEWPYGPTGEVWAEEWYGPSYGGYGAFAPRGGGRGRGGRGAMMTGYGAMPRGLFLGYSPGRGMRNRRGARRGNGPDSWGSQPIAQQPLDSGAGGDF